MHSLVLSIPMTMLASHCLDLEFTFNTFFDSSASCIISKETARPLVSPVGEDHSQTGGKIGVLMLILVEHPGS